MTNAIETIYKGYRFRSRLEARWAVFFDSLGIPWIYEPEGIDLGNGLRYLPDFYLPDCKQFFEVKGILDDDDREKIQALISKGYSVTIGYDDGRFEACDNWRGEGFSQSKGGVSWLCKCRKCGMYWFMQSNGVYDCQCCGHYEGDSGFQVLMECDPVGRGQFDDTKLWDVARQARFEHGETPGGRK